MVKDCQCICKEKAKGPKEWKGLTNFKIIELDIIRGLPGHTNIDFVMAKNKKDAIEKYYHQFSGASNRILIYPEGCAEVYERPKEKRISTESNGKPMYPSSEAAEEALAH